jgi:hypothetical protein
VARVSKVNKSRVERTCGRTGHTIPVGSVVYSAAPGWRGRTLYRCASHPFRESELTTSLAAEPMAARESFIESANSLDHESTDALEQLQGLWEELTGSVREYADQRRESAEAWEHGNSQLEEYADIAESAADELEQWEPEEWGGDEEARDWDVEEVPEPEEEPDEPDADDYDDDDDFMAALREYDEAFAAWEAAVELRSEWEAQRDNHEEAVNDWQQHVEQQVQAAIDTAEGVEF